MWPRAENTQVASAEGAVLIAEEALEEYDVVVIPGSGASVVYT